MEKRFRKRPYTTWRRDSGRDHIQHGEEIQKETIYNMEKRFIIYHVFFDTF